MNEEATGRERFEGADAKGIASMISRLETKLGQEHKENRGDLQDMRENIAELRKAFPGEDPEGHRRFHDALIAESLARKAFWSDLRGKLIEKGIWAVILFLCAAVGFYIKEKS